MDEAVNAAGPGDPAPRAADPPGTRRAAWAVAVVFAASGLLFASWASRIPQVRDSLELTAAQLGAAIMSIAVGSVIALPASGLIVQRVGATRAVAASAIVAAAGMAAVAAGVLVGLPMLVVGLFVLGFSLAVWDVAMNVEGAAVERLRSAPLMPRLHAAFSIGTVAGALLGALMNALGIPVTVHLLGAGLLCASAAVVSTRAFVAEGSGPTPRGARRALGRAWRERRTLTIGVLVLAISFAEGAGMDWIGVAAVDGYGASASFASIGFAVFVTGVTLARFAGTRVLARFGRVVSLRAGAILAGAGVLAVVLGGSMPALVLGALMWGAGIALGFPVAMSAAADEQDMAAPRVSVVSTIGYTAFLAGPAVIGIVADRSDVSRALLLVPAALAVAFLTAGATRPPVGERGDEVQD